MDGTYVIGGWVGPRDDLAAVASTGNRTPVVQPVAYSLDCER
jgi:hypothetical protein